MNGGKTCSYQRVTATISQRNNGQALRSGSLCNIQLDVISANFIFDLGCINQSLLAGSPLLFSLAQSSKGKGVAACNDDAASENVTERRWDEVLPNDLPDGDIRPREEAKWEHGDRVMSVAWHPEGTKLATGSADKFARVFDLGTAAEDAKWRHASSTPTFVLGQR